MRSRASALRERLVPRASDASTISSLDDPRAAARFLGLAYVAGASLAIASMAFPQPPRTDVAGLLGIYAVALAVGGYLLLRGSRVTARETSGALLIGTVLVSLAIHFTDERTGVYSLFYVWIAIESVYFLSRGAALVQVVGVAVAFGLVLMSERPPGAEEQWVITVGTVALAGILVGALKANVERLIGRLAAAAHTDPLTGLSNRRAFQDAVEVELERARRGQRPVSLLVADLDHFKRVNDLLGHPSGDLVLKQFAAQMTRLTRTIDTPARLGGEEFAIVLPEAARHDALLVAERLRRAVKSEFVDTAAPLTVSIGVTCFPDDGASADDLLRAGDQALYAAKKLGRDRTVLYNAEVIADVVPGEAATEAQTPGQLSVVLVLAETIDARDSGTAQHSQAVSRYARVAAVGLGLPQTLIERVALAGVLHDVGKIGVADAVLQKRGPLDEEDWAHIRRHPELGARILAGADLPDIAEWVFAHHERVDGSGYPLGLRGEEIPLGARILAVADAYEAMTSTRPYRAAMPHEDAAAELRRCAGTQFDARVVEALLAAQRIEWQPAGVSDELSPAG
jgi:diguanylate cyclase (GGDEF)-like protein